jgi:hypothetical protein
MVNKQLTGGWDVSRESGPAAQIVRFLCKKAVLTNQTTGAGILRSRFGSADSWVIKKAVGSSCRGKLRNCSNCGLSLLFIVIFPIHRRL